MNVAIWGCGQGGSIVRHWLPENCSLVAYIDKDPEKQNTSYFGVPVLPPEDILKSDIDLVWIAVLNRSATSDIKARLSSMGFGGEIRTLFPLKDDIDLRLAQARLIAQQIKKRNLSGDVAELGVYRGEFASALNEIFSDRKLYLFDTFSGFDEKDLKTEAAEGHSRSKLGDFSDTSADAVMRRMPHPENVRIFKGYFPDTLPDNLPSLCFVSLDPDLYEPTYSGLCAFYPKLVNGGAIMIHDYNSLQFKGVAKAVDKFCAENRIMPIPLPDLHGSTVIIKPL